MPEIPKGATVPTDHNKSAAQIEAEGGGTTDVVWRDFSFTVATDPDNWAVETTLAFEEGKAASGIRSILGPKQWAEFMKSKPVNRDMGELFNEIAKTLGLETSGE